MSWNPGSSTFAGVRWVVKNHFELKNATRVLLEGNVFENVWGGFSQFGAHILLTPKNQAQGSQNLCPICSVTQVTIRYNRFSTAAQVFQIANGKNGNGAYAKAGGFYSIHDNVADNLAYRGCYRCTNQYNQMSTGLDAPTANLLSNVSIDHNTFVVGTAVENSPTQYWFLGSAVHDRNSSPIYRSRIMCLRAVITGRGRLESPRTALTTVPARVQSSTRAGATGNFLET
jgi:hypothetical protein